MTRTTITLPDELPRLVKDEAQRRRSTRVSGVVRDSIVQTLVASGCRELGFAAIVDDLRLPAAADLDEELDRSWADDLASRRR